MKLVNQRLRVWHASPWPVTAAWMYGLQTLLLAAALVSCRRPSRASLTAAQIGCEPRDISVSKASTSAGPGDSSETWVAECRGQRFICSERSTNLSAGYVASTPSGPVYMTPTSHPTSHDVSCREELGHATDRHEGAIAVPPSAPAVPPSAPKSAPPTGAAGFAYGEGSEAAQQACEGAGKTYDGSASQAECSGAATDLGFAASVSLNFCKGRTCGVTIQHKPESAWTSAFVELKQALVAKYGTPAESKSAIPSWCRSETDFVACLQEGRLRLHITWTWPSGERINLTAGKPVRGDGDAALRVQYVKPVGLGVAASAL